MAIFAVTYTYTDDAPGRDSFRAEHREFLNSSGWTLLSGPLGEPAGALLVVEGVDAEQVGTALAADPFQREGLVARCEIRPYEPVGGALASAFSGHSA